MTQLLRRVQYPAYQAPVIFSANQAETVTESRWHQPWSDPMGTIFGKVRAGAAIALAASGLFAPVLTPEQTPEQVTESRWHQEWTQPNGTIFGKKYQGYAVVLASASGPFAPVLTTGQFSETIVESEWHQPWSQPYLTTTNRSRIALAASGAFQGAVNVDIIDASKQPRWYQELATPSSVKTRVGTPYLPTYLVASGAVVDPYALTQPEAVLESKWHQPWSEPVRRLSDKYLQPSLQQAQVQGAVNVDTIDSSKQPRWYKQWVDPYLTKTNQSRIALIASGFVIDPAALLSPETTGMESKWHQPWSEPASTRTSLNPQMRVALQSTTTIDPYALTQPETVTESRWHQPWSEPVRLQSALYLAVYEQSAAVTDLEPFVAFSWYDWLSEPVREKPGMRKDLQPAFTTSAQAFTFASGRGYLIC